MSESAPLSTAADGGAASGAYRVVARRYRPQRFDELVGQEHVARGLSGAIVSGRIGHAYLFTGARGVGKTSAARIFAKALECVQGPAAEPCNVCDACDAVSAGQDVDVVEIDAASNRGIDEIRQLRQNVAVRPARGRYKIYIIDEVHMLTREAFNALLKTLEEPPTHVKFVLCTTEPEKLPITILSRCQRFDFVTVDAPAIARRLEQIVAAEGKTVSPEALALIARRAAGSMRDSQSLLEQLLGSASGSIGVDDVHAVIGTGREEKVGLLVAAIANRDAKQALEALDGALAGGADPGGVLEQLLAAWRDSLLASVGCGPEMMLEGEGLGVDLVAIGRSLGTETILAMLQIIDHTLARMRSSGHATVLAEMAVVRMARLEDLDTLAAAVERVAAGLPTPPSAGPSAGHAAPLRALPTAAPPVPAETPREKKTTHLTAAPIAAEPVRPVLAPPAPEPGQVTAALPALEPAPKQPVVAAESTPLPARPLEFWLQAGEAEGGLVADFAATASTAVWRGEVLEVTIPASATTALSFLRRPTTTTGLNQALSAACGRPVRYQLVVEAAVAVADEPGAAPPPPVAVRSQAGLLREALEHPLVGHALKLFDAAVRKVEPARPRPPAELTPAVAAETPAGGAVADESPRGSDEPSAGADSE